MQYFVDDENTKYEKENLINFISDKNAYGFIAKDEDKIVGFSYGYTLLRPDGKQDFYLHAIDIMKEYQGNGYGTELMNFIKEYIKEIGCRKMFLITNKSNISACKCYEKAGGVNNADDKLAGIGRVVGDYSIVCMLSDICVKPEFQGNGIGLKIVNELKRLIEEGVKVGEKMQIELTPTAGNEEFYKKAGFKYKPDVITGMYLWIKK